MAFGHGQHVAQVAMLQSGAQARVRSVDLVPATLDLSDRAKWRDPYRAREAHTQDADMATTPQSPQTTAAHSASTSCKEDGIRPR